MADTTRADEEPLPQPSDERELLAAGIAQDGIEADILRRALEDEGIEALIDSSRAGMVEKLSSPSDGWRLMVPAPDLARARALISEHRAALEADPEAGARAAEAGEAAEEAGETVPSGN
jgi:hypothetical protein